MSSEEHTSAISAVLPLFPDESTSVSMMHHAMDVVKIAVHKLNPGQTPVITMDQPLYSLGKQIQWTWPESHGGNEFVLILGGLHIEMAVLEMIGDWLDKSGWVDSEALIQANIASSGTAESFLKVSHVTRTRWAHQITACSLYNILLCKEYNNDMKITVTDQVVFMEEWCTRQQENVPQFFYWYTTLQLQFLALTFIRSLREANFKLYIDSLTKLVLWCFCLDQTNYARWLSVHIWDMTSLASQHPDIVSAFSEGKFTVQKTARLFLSTQ